MPMWTTPCRTLYTARHQLLALPKEIASKRIAKKVERLLDKRMSEHNSKKKWHMESAIQSTPKSSRLRQGQQQRANHLSAVLHEHITNLVHTGAIANDLNALGFEITKVRILPDLSHVQVQWMPTSTNDDQIEQHLEQCAIDLRHELTSLKVIGSMPPIQFKKDRTAERVQTVETLLKKADFGPDFVPTDLADSLKSEPLVKISQMPKSLQAKISKLSQDLNLSDNTEPSLCQPDNSNTMESGHTPPPRPISEEKEKILANFEDLKLRSDLFELDHEALHHRLVTAKGRKKQVQDGANSQTLVNNGRGSVKKLNLTQSFPSGLGQKKKQGRVMQEEQRNARSLTLTDLLNENSDGHELDLCRYDNEDDDSCYDVDVWQNDVPDYDDEVN